MDLQWKPVARITALIAPVPKPAKRLIPCKISRSSRTFTAPRQISGAAPRENEVFDVVVQLLHVFNTQRS